MFARATLSYFSAPPGHYWEWDLRDASDAGYTCGENAVVWSDDRSTILLRAELMPLLHSMVPEGLPPLGAVLLLVAAASDRWDADRMRQRLFDAAQRATGDMSVPRGVVVSWGHVRVGLEAIHALPKGLRSSGIARAALLRMVFEGAFNRLPSSISDTIMVEFEESYDLDDFQERTPDLNGLARILRDLSILGKAFDQLPLKKLEQRLRTGMDTDVTDQLELPFQEKISALVPEVPEDLLDALEKDGGELAQVAGMVRRLAAILHVPKSVTLQEELPLGGVSDITNRGDPSRLLITELAWDAMTFAVRLAQGEALYMRRESPPAEPPPKRVIVLDTGIFMWGRPRLFALGVALALQRQKAVNARVLTVVKGALVPVLLNSVTTVRTQLARLEALPNPAKALRGLTHDESLALLPDEELFLITHPAVLEKLVPLPIWQSLAGQVPLHSLQVDREGDLTLSRHSLAGARILTEARMDLDHLLEGGSVASVSLISEEKRLPKFYHQKPWPLYHPVAPKDGKAIPISGDGYVGESAAGSICYWKAKSHAGQVLLPQTPLLPLAAVAVDPEDATVVFLMFCSPYSKPLELHVISLTAKSHSYQHTLDIRLVDLVGVRLQTGALIVHQTSRSEALSLRDGRVIASMTHRSNLSAGQDLPWFDGEQFHLKSGTKTLSFRTTTCEVPLPTNRSHRITNIAEVGFSLLGGLIIQKEKGRMYQLELKEKGSLEWVMANDTKATFRPLLPMNLAHWPNHGLTQAEFSDGRRVIYDPRGFLHVLGKGDNAYELSVVLVKGCTVAWQRTGFFYGAPRLLWGEKLGASVSLKAVCKQLFLSCSETPPTQPSKSAFSQTKRLF